MFGLACVRKAVNASGCWQRYFPRASRSKQDFGECVPLTTTDLRLLVAEGVLMNSAKKCQPIPPDRHSDFGKVQSSAIKFDGNIKVYACHL